MNAARLLWVATLLGGTPAVAQQASFDLVVRGGRVIDPETRTDRIANVGIRGGTVVTVTDAPITGTRVIEARGRVVAPGFIDILSGAITPEGGRYKVTDGVTSLLAMHGGPVDVAGWYESLGRGGMLVNYGTTVGHGALRAAVGITDREKAATDEQVSEMVRLARQAILQGAVGIGFGVQYTPGASEEEVLALFRLGAELGVPAHLHTRFLGPLPPENSVKGIQEVIADAAATGVSAQVVHLNSISVTQRGVETALELIAGARARGIDVMADAYPWEAGSTALESAVFDPGWPQRMTITYSDIELVKTGERLTEATFKQYREDGKPDGVVIHFVTKGANVAALTHPLVMVASDGGIQEGRGHPRGAGTFAKFLREYVREGRHLSLMEGIRKMTLMPAERMVKAAPVMRRKGRLSPGADADIVVFDPARVRERATYAEPAQYSEGFDYVVVNGVVVVDRGKLVDGVAAGRPIRGAP
ncbi:MAG: amidohydrolase family protein [Gemmatimonadales bacterium]